MKAQVWNRTSTCCNDMIAGRSLTLALVFKQVINTYKLKKQVPIRFAFTQQGPDHSPFWKSTCISKLFRMNCAQETHDREVGAEEYGAASSRQKKVAEEESARKATLRLSASFLHIFQ